MMEMLAASQGLSINDPGFWMPLALMALLFLLMVAGVIFDGFDVGVGILLQFAPAEERGRMMALLSPWQDANKFWLLLSIGFFVAAFPFAWGGYFQQTVWASGAFGDGGHGAQCVFRVSYSRAHRA
jgi:cytochrome bd ubiquinol oxidase subunit II